MDERPQDVVARGYDQGADLFEAWQRQVRDPGRLQRLEELLGLLPGRPDVLELGAGAGGETTRILAERCCSLLGVDISAEQVRRARARIRTATFLCADVTALELEADSYDAVVALYVLNHVPREELGRLLRNVGRWLRPTGYLLATFGASDLPAWRGPWLGDVETFFSGFEPEVTLELVTAAGLSIVQHELETIAEPEGPATVLWVLACKEGQPESGIRREG